MGMPARKLEFEEVTVEDRLTKLESNVAHIQSDLSEIKGDIRHLDAKIDSVKDSIAALALSTEKSISKLIIWTVGLVAAVLTAMARGFHWF
jgi:peptidoglycan hydrolase CwlO-like protein